MTKRQYSAACAAFVEGGWITERNNRGKQPRYALPGTPWKGRVGDLYVVLYRVEGGEPWDMRYIAPGDFDGLTAVLARLVARREEGA